MGRTLRHWLLIAGVGLGLSLLGAYWLPQYGTTGLIATALLSTQAFSLAHWQVWLAIGALLLWQNRRKIGSGLLGGPGRLAKSTGR